LVDQSVTAADVVPIATALVVHGETWFSQNSILPTTLLGMRLICNTPARAHLGARSVNVKPSPAGSHQSRDRSRAADTPASAMRMSDLTMWVEMDDDGSVRTIREGV
jgi:hypothetical protein